MKAVLSLFIQASGSCLLNSAFPHERILHIYLCFLTFHQTVSNVSIYDDQATHHLLTFAKILTTADSRNNLTRLHRRFSTALPIASSSQT